jgi:hypothetical protein
MSFYIPPEIRRRLEMRRDPYQYSEMTTMFPDLKEPPPPFVMGPFAETQALLQLHQRLANSKRAVALYQQEIKRLESLLPRTRKRKPRKSRKSKSKCPRRLKKCTKRMTRMKRLYRSNLRMASEGVRVPVRTILPDIYKALFK